MYFKAFVLVYAERSKIMQPAIGLVLHSLCHLYMPFSKCHSSQVYCQVVYAQIYSPLVFYLMTALKSWQNTSDFTIFFSKELLLSGMTYATLLFSQCIFGLSVIVFCHEKVPSCTSNFGLWNSLLSSVLPVLTIDLSTWLMASCHYLLLLLPLEKGIFLQNSTHIFHTTCHILPNVTGLMQLQAQHQQPVVVFVNLGTQRLKQHG